MDEWLCVQIGERQVRIVMVDGKAFEDHSVLMHSESRKMARKSYSRCARDDRERDGGA
jgi:hypothetical protein